MFGVTLVRNKAAFLVEWLDFHFDQGFDFFFIYNHNASDVETQRVLVPYLQSKKVTLIDAVATFPVECNHSQRHSQHWYNVCQASVFLQALDILRIFHSSDANTWLAVFDIDEFIFGQKKCAREVLQAMPPSVDFVTVHARVFGASNYTNNSQFVSVLHSHLHRASLAFHDHWKSISRVSSPFVKYPSVHDPGCVVFMCSSITMPSHNSMLNMNHYQYVSLEELQRKCIDNHNTFYSNIGKNQALQDAYNSIYDDSILHATPCTTRRLSTA
jgi:hypothetical protein